MKKLKMNAYYLAVLVCLVILVIAGSYFVYKAYHPSETLRQNQQQDLTLQPTPVTPAPAQSTSPAVSVPGSTQDPGSPRCDSPPVVDSQIPVLANISIAIRDPVPGIRYSLGENDSGKTIMLGTGDIVEINLSGSRGLASTGSSRSPGAG
jgi:hypothetical protein